MTRGLARMGLALFAIVACLELLQSASAYREIIHDQDWEALRAFAAKTPAHDVWLLDAPWLAPRTRMELPQFAQEEALGRPDLWSAQTLHIVALRTAPPRAEWRTELEPQAVPRVRETRTFGALHVHTMTLDPHRRELASLRDHDALRVFSGDQACRRTRNAARWTCSHDGTVRERIVEVAGRARRCAALEVADGTTLRLRYAGMPTGELLRGHIGFTDFNGVLRNDAPARLELWIDDDLHLRSVATDNEGWKAFKVPVTPGTHDVELRITQTLQGQWDRRGYAPTPSRPACVELRSLSATASSP